MYKSIFSKKSLTQKVVNKVNRPLIFALTGFALNFIAYYPGFMSSDTLDQYNQSITQNYGDWHPPVMAALWSVLGIFSKGPQVMLAFQLVLFWASFYLLATTWFSSLRSSVILFVGFLFAPFIQNFIGYVAKDVQMAVTWLLSFSIMMRAEYLKRRMTRAEAVLAFVLIVYGTLVRINALPGALPLFFLWFGNYSRWKKLSYALVATPFAIFVIILSQALFSAILKPNKQYAEYKFYMQDLSGIYVKTNKNYFPTFMNQHPGFDTNYLKVNYTSATLDNLWWNKNISFPAMNDGTIDDVQTAWVKSIVENPGAYLENRLDGFLYFLYIKERTPIVYYMNRIDENGFGFTYKRNFISDLFLVPIEFQSNMPYMRPWFWLLLNVVILGVAFLMQSRRMRMAVLVLSISSLFYLLPQFFIFPIDTDFRYLYWNCIVLFLCLYFIYKDQRLKLQS